MNSAKAKDDEWNVVEHMEHTMKDSGMELLAKVDRVDPPPFLITRIEARIASLRNERPSRSWVVAMAMSILLLLVVNTVLVLPGGSSASDPARIAASVGLQMDNQLYP